MTQPEYTFVIPGACPPKGSRVPTGRRGRATRESSKRVEPWTTAAVKAMRGPDGKPRASFSGPVYVGLTFTFKRPKVTEFPFPTATTIGDVDKLCRCALDALTKAGVIEDDRFVVQLRDPVKLWAPANATIVRVGSVTPEEIETRAWQLSMMRSMTSRPPSKNPFASLGLGPSRGAVLAPRRDLLDVTPYPGAPREMIPGMICTDPTCTLPHTGA